ncbi:YdcF family protein [Bacillus xiapuensis]|uniref:YdcF family protein n=1 Tax=Bacillus xiapuensis TaxID=2014075 RepID=UPI000C240AB7|nr:YdcF family protein [Bacillus xiapuensis]
MKKRKGLVVGSLLILMMIGGCTYLYHQMKKTASKQPPSHVPILMVLGAKVNGTDMSPSLQERAKTALKYARENPDTKVIVSGGKGPGEAITEAAALKQFFLENGIEEKRIFVEGRSTSTYENFVFSKKLWNIKEAVVVSNDFHLYRSKKIAESQGIKMYPLAAPTPDAIKIHAYAREYAAIFKWYLTGK